MQNHDSLKRFWILTLFSAAGVLGATLWGVDHHHVGTHEAYAGDALPLDANIFVALSKKIVPSVVNISTLSTVKGSDYNGAGPGNPDDLFRRFFEDFFRRHGGNQRGQNPDDGGDDDGGGGNGGANPPTPNGPNAKLPKAMSLGSGFIIDASGLILTNNHVVADADEIKISFTESEDEKPTDGEVVGRDTELDIALIRVKTKRELVAVTLGDSDVSEVGEYVLAVGNPFGQGHSVTHGIISAKGRFAPDFPLAYYLQTDAPINPGNSGGPLVNLKGEVIGINNAIDQRAQGIGFAIPITLVKKILPQLRTKGTVARGYIGVLVNELSPEVAGKIGAPKDLKAPFVTHVYPGEPADKAGLKPYDVITEFNGKTIHTSSELVMAVTQVDVGNSAPMKVLRNGSAKELSIKVALRPGAEPTPKPSPKGKTKKESHIDTGMSLDEMTPDIARDLGMPDKTTGVVVNGTTYDGPADRAGILRGDVIIEVDKKAVKGVDQFFSIVKDKKSYLVRVRRTDPQGREVFAVVVLDLKGGGDEKDKE